MSQPIANFTFGSQDLVAVMVVVVAVMVEEDHTEEDHMEEEEVVIGKVWVQFVY